MDAEELMRLAVLGARARLIEIDAEREKLNAERERLIAKFPELARKQRAPYKDNRGPAEPVVLFDAAAPSKQTKRGKRKEPERGTKTQRIIAMLRAGRTPREIADELDADKSWIYKLALKVGIDTSRNNRADLALPKGRQRRTFSDETKAEILGRVRKGEYVIDLAREYAMRESVIRRWCAIAKVRPTDIPMEERTRRTLAAKAAKAAAAPNEQGNKGEG